MRNELDWCEMKSVSMGVGDGYMVVRWCREGGHAKRAEVMQRSVVGR